MPNTTWKALERRIARQLGGKRVGNTGRSTPDIESEWLIVECKQRESLPRWLVEALAQARGYASEEKLPILVLHERGRHDSLVVMALSDFCDFFVGD